MIILRKVSKYGPKVLKKKKKGKIIILWKKKSLFGISPGLFLESN